MNESDECLPLCSEASTSSSNSLVENIDINLPRILDGKFFKFSKEESTDRKRVGLCMLCLPKKVTISGTLPSTSNFVTHLKRKHGETALNDYKTYFGSNKKTKKTTSEPQSQSKAKKVSQEEFNGNIVKFFIHSMIPLRAIEDPYLKKSYENAGMCQNGLTLMSRRSLGRVMQDYYTKEIQDIKTVLRDTLYVCTTADIWSGKKRSFIGVTAHWITSDLQRKSKTLACRRFKGTHSYDRIAFLLEDIHGAFGIDSRKVLSTITDNGSNFVKAFKEFGVEIDTCDSIEVVEFNDIDPDVEDIFNASEDVQSEVSSTTSHDKSETDPLPLENARVSLELPAHLRCSAHKLNLCATTDAGKVLRNQNTLLSKTHERVINKCNKLWNAAGRPKSAEVIQTVLGHTLSRPGDTRWNSTYDALGQIYAIKDKSISLYEVLKISGSGQLWQNEFNYIDEYLKCSKPIAEALDILQGEKDMFYGLLLPCLLSLRRKLKKLCNENFFYCNDLARKHLESLNNRFNDIFDFSNAKAQNAAIAAISLPRFKTKWFTCIPIEEHQRLKTFFKAAIAKEVTENAEFSSAINKQNKEDFFQFDSSSSDTEEDVCRVQRSKADLIVSCYLSDMDRELNSLHRYPEVKKVFIKYNTPLPSSAPVERLFSYATMINHPKSHRLSDEMFEKRVVLKANLND
uniref:HAT C-terminal dimerisation domain-containing protein n=1 Tax=Heliothis virescens TaxID=7102 RepID=A0A2A4JC28_HELVI